MKSLLLFFVFVVSNKYDFITNDYARDTQNFGKCTYAVIHNFKLSAISQTYNLIYAVHTAVGWS